MNSVWIIFKKEFKSFFKSPTWYLVAGLVSLLLSWLYPAQLKMFGEILNNYVMRPEIPKTQLNIHYGVFLRELSYLNLLMIFVVPALNMKLLSEEKKLKTFDLLLTSPITSFQIVFGKYLASICAIFGIVFVAFLYPLVTTIMVSVDWGPLLMAFVGLFIVGAVYSAMNLFASSLTENGIIAFVTAVILNISVWFVGIGAEVADSEVSRKFFEHLSLNSHLSGMVEGSFKTQSIVYFFSIIALFVFLSERVVESYRWR